MGVMHHNAVIATTWDHREVERIYEWRSKLDPWWKDLFIVGPIAINNSITVCMCPDGSKEGWGKSDLGDKMRALFIAKLEESKYEDGSSPWSWVEVGFGEFGQEVIRGNCTNQYA